MSDVKTTVCDLLFSLDHFEEVADGFHLNAWITHRREPLTHASILMNSNLWVTDLALNPRPDVVEQLRKIAPHSLHSGMAITAPIDRRHLRGTHDQLQIIVRQGTRELGSVDCPVRNFQQEAARLPIPPFDMAQLVGGHAGFLQTGQRLYHDIKSNVERYRTYKDLDKVLDWGCGVGRILRYLTEDVASDKISACDIDKGAIAWARKHFAGPSFCEIPAYPPTPYKDESFDLIYGVSIFTHLNELAQDRWLEELRRITRKGGIVAVSVLGESTAPTELQSVIRRNGIADVLSPQSEQLAPYSNNEYYRVTHHSRDYILSRWSKCFRLLEYIEFGINSHQDLVLMEKQ